VASAAALGLGALQGLLVLGRQEKSDIGTLLSALTAAAAGVPVALANAWDLSTALLTNAVFAVMGGVAMLTVRELIPKRKREAGLAAYVGWLVAVVAVLALATRALSGEVPAYLAWALAPTLSASVALLLTRPAAKHLRAVGWTLAAANVATFLVLAFA
jgi:hypothetical protein